MKIWLGALMAAVALTVMPVDVDAKRLGGGKSTGMQRDMPARTAPDAPAGKPATPAGAQNPTAPAGQQAAAPAAGMAGAAAAPAKRSWLGPLAGVAAGLGLAALMSHLGLGEEFASFLLIALLVVAGFVIVRLIMRRFGPQPALKTASPHVGGGAQVAWPTQPASGIVPAAPVSMPTPEAAVPTTPVSVEPAAPVVAKAFVPAAFDSPAFERVAKMIFIRMQAANDAGDLNDLRTFTTPEMFASAALDIQERGSQAQQTEVVRVEAQVLDVAQDDRQQIVSVRFHGEVREESGAAAVPFNEVWHMVKPLDDSRSWAVAGIEQMN